MVRRRQFCVEMVVDPQCAIDHGVVQCDKPVGNMMKNFFPPEGAMNGAVAIAPIVTANAPTNEEDVTAADIIIELGVGGPRTARTASSESCQCPREPYRMSQSRFSTQLDYGVVPDSLRDLDA